MLKPPENADASEWHRYFAKIANNRAWELSVESRNAAEDREMLDAAHAAAWHWQIVGTELHWMRAKMLLAEVHAALGDGTMAVDYARDVHAYFLGKADTPDWEVAFAHVVYAHAAHAAGDRAAHRSAHRQATAAIESIADADDRDIVLKSFRQVAAP